MIRLGGVTEPYIINIIVDDVTVTVRPLTTLDMAIAQHAVGIEIEELEESQKKCLENGLISDISIIDLKDPAKRAGYSKRLMIRQLAIRHITAWTGVTVDDAGTLAELNPENIKAFVDEFPIGEIFYTKFVTSQRELSAAKKESGTDAHGDSNPAPVPNTAKDVNRTESPAPKESQD